AQPTEGLVDGVRANVMTANELNIVADVAAPRGVAAVAGHARMRLQEHRRALLRRQGTDALGDALHVLVTEGDELLRLGLRAGQLAQDAQARLQILERAGEKVDEYHLDTTRLQLGHLRVRGPAAGGHDGDIGSGRQHRLDIEGLCRTGNAGYVFQLRI